MHIYSKQALGKAGVDKLGIALRFMPIWTETIIKIANDIRNNFFLHTHAKYVSADVTSKYYTPVETTVTIVCNR